MKLSQAVQENDQRIPQVVGGKAAARAKGIGLRRGSRSNEAGVAVLIALFVLILIGALAVSLILASGTETSLTQNYRSSTSAYYAGIAGLEEMRERLVPNDPNSLNVTYYPQPFPLSQVTYILNPLPGEVVSPSIAGTKYADSEYQAEFGVAVSTRTIQTIGSIWANAGANAGTQAPLYKWVRLNPVTEQSLGIDVDNNGDYDNTTPLWFDSSLQTRGAMTFPTGATTQTQALEITALAVMPDSSERLMQYVVAPVQFGLNFGSPLTLAGPNILLQPANSNGYYINGQDGSGTPAVSPKNCTTNPSTDLPAVGVTNSTQQTSVQTQIASGGKGGNYTGGNCSGTPCVATVTNTDNPLMNSPSGMETLIQEIENNANVVVYGNATQSNLPASMGVNNGNCTPGIAVVEGDFTMSGNYTGCGLLVVTGNFTYDGNDGWNGIILVVGKGTTTFTGNGGGNNEFNGALYTATIYDASGNVLPSFGTVNFDINGGGGNGVYYNSCWIKSAQGAPVLKILSFHETPYSN